MPSPHTTFQSPVPRSCPAPGTARWVFPTVPADNHRLERWCLTLGPLVTDTMPDPAFGPLGPGDSLAIAVWNVNAGAGDMLAFVRRELGLDCRGAPPHPATGAGHFVLLAQEALRRSNEIPDAPAGGIVAPAASERIRPGERVDIVAVARRCGLALFYGPQARNGLEPREGVREDRGAAILSTLPLSDLVLVELPFESARRVVPVATVRDGRGRPLRLASLHLITTPPPWRILVTGNSSRLRHALGIVDALRLIDAAGRDALPATIVAGDLNTWSTREAAFRHLRDRFPDSPPPLRQPTRGPFPTDHLFFRRGRPPVGRLLAETYRRVDDTYYSDHHPIMAWFRFAER